MGKQVTFLSVTLIILNYLYIQLKGTATSQTAAIQGHIVVNYGLFGGSISRQVIGAPTTFELKSKCDH